MTRNLTDLLVTSRTERWCRERGGGGRGKGGGGGVGVAYRGLPVITAREDLEECAVTSAWVCV